MLSSSGRKDGALGLTLAIRGAKEDREKERLGVTATCLRRVHQEVSGHEFEDRSCTAMPGPVMTSVKLLPG
eukprot:85068-Rhodomonas_salina.4